jgi:hypothetical protein
MPTYSQVTRLALKKILFPMVTGHLSAQDGRVWLESLQRLAVDTLAMAGGVGSGPPGAWLPVDDGASLGLKRHKAAGCQQPARKLRRKSC